MKKLILFVLCLVVLMCNGYAEEELTVPESVIPAESNIPALAWAEFDPAVIDAKMLDRLQDRLVRREEMRREVIQQVREMNNNLEVKERQLERLNGTVIELREHIAELMDAKTN